MSDKRLFTPGPLTTSHSVKAAMLRDLGSRDAEFIHMVREIRTELLHLAGQTNDSRYTTVLMQGSGTFGVESLITTAIPPHGKLLILINGAYGRRIHAIATHLKINTASLIYAENQVPSVTELDSALQNDPDITHVAVVHCETTTGILNPIRALGEVVAKHARLYLVDAMSSFGAIPINLEAAHIHYLVSSSNKCIEGVPGFSFALCDAQQLAQCQHHARSISLDLYAQWRGLERDGQFRFTPPVHSLMAFRQALRELAAEGGVVGRQARYQNNHDIIYTGMTAMGFTPYLALQDQSPIITTFHYPDHPNFDFDTFYQHLSERDCVIYPGKLTQADCFRIGNIGRLNAQDMHALLDAIRATLEAMTIPLPLNPITQEHLSS